MIISSNDVDRLRLDDVEPALLAEAREAFERGDGAALASCAIAGRLLSVVVFNSGALRGRGIYEPALIEALVGCQVNNAHWPVDRLEQALRDAERAKLRAAGDPLPGPGPFTVYRGVYGRGPARRVRGLSWSDSLDVACWYALRLGGHDPAVVAARLDADDVYCFTDQRSEREFIARPDKYKRLTLTHDEMEAGRQRHCEVLRQRR